MVRGGYYWRKPGEDPPGPPGSGEDPPGPPGSGEDLEILEKTWRRPGDTGEDMEFLYQPMVNRR